MDSELKQAVDIVKRAKATTAYWDSVRVRGRESEALRAFDCYTREEAISMLAVVQKVRIFKRDGKICIE